MVIYLLLVAVIMFACVLFNRISSKYGIPMLFAFILLGMFFGTDGVGKIDFSDYDTTEQICSIALIFIMFYGGFGTKWSEAKPIAAKAIILSSVGTIATAGLVGLFCFLVLKIEVLESFLIGSVIASTDAASVFSILRSKKLNLRYNNASLLEVESGSNDPFSYMLTIIILSLMKNGEVKAGQFIYMLFSQVVFGVILGFLIAGLALFILKRFKFGSSGFDTIFIIAISILSYALTTLIGGNGYLSVYITGIILGNSKIPNKQILVNFFDGATGLCQMILFFLLGLLSFPSKLPGVAFIGLMIALFLTFVARPIAVSLILIPFKSKLKEITLVSWCGMRGAASIVFAIMAVSAKNNGFININNDIFHIVFFIVLFSILLQGGLLPFMSRKLDMIDVDSDVMKTFTDYSDEFPIQFLQFRMVATHPWVNKPLSTIVLPPESILVLLIRDNEKIIPNGKTVIHENDLVILSGKASEQINGIHLYEKTIKKGDEWLNKSIATIKEEDKLIIVIKRKKNIVIPKGSTILKEGDILVINNPIN